MSIKNYDREFKFNAVKLYRESQKPMSKKGSSCLKGLLKDALKIKRLKRKQEKSITKAEVLTEVLEYMHRYNV